MDGLMGLSPDKSQINIFQIAAKERQINSSLIALELGRRKYKEHHICTTMSAMVISQRLSTQKAGVYFADPS